MAIDNSKPAKGSAHHSDIEAPGRACSSAAKAAPGNSMAKAIAAAAMMPALIREKPP
ncbi:hypothetical protein MesoLj113a_05920 [Mesorhizobium sp. 113-1-2]|nr:hypothetical protein MesoLj113a_05920 [Mesorhizobium sp. 113-1-2]